jgi:hypothetical protein
VPVTVAVALTVVVVVVVVTVVVTGEGVMMAVRKTVEVDSVTLAVLPAS